MEGGQIGPLAVSYFSATNEAARGGKVRAVREMSFPQRYN